jgi:hypothetical protein
MYPIASRPVCRGPSSRAFRRAPLLLACLAALGGHGPASAAPRVDALTFPASGLSPFNPQCSNTSFGGLLQPNTEVEPFVASNPQDPLNLVGVWQQDRWTSGGAQGQGTGYSFDGGVTWHRLFLPFTVCAGGNAANGGNYQRASDPWVSFSPNGVVHQSALAFNLFALPDQVSSAILASRSTDGGKTWSPPAALITDTADHLDDKDTITADPTDSRYVYATWERLSNLPDEGLGPTMVARSVDNGATWEPASIAYDPGPLAQTLGNRIEVLPDGTLLDVFAVIDFAAQTVTLQVIRSSDKGATWSAPTFIADDLAIGASDPDTGEVIRDGAGIPQMAISPTGKISVVWQDARFSGGLLDGIVLSESTDGGATWSAPVQINHDPLVVAFTPSVRVREDGTVGVSYYDLRHNTPDPATLLTDLWLTRSRDGLTWRESRVTATFDLATAPLSGGLFLGDYQGITSIGPVFVPFFAKTNGDPADPDDIYSHLALPRHRAGASLGSPALAAQVALEEASLPVTHARAMDRTMSEVPPALRIAAWRAMERSQRARIPDWDARVAARQAAGR